MDYRRGAHEMQVYSLLDSVEAQADLDKIADLPDPTPEQETWLDRLGIEESQDLAYKVKVVAAVLAIHRLFHEDCDEAIELERQYGGNLLQKVIEEKRIKLHTYLNGDYMPDKDFITGKDYDDGLKFVTNLYDENNMLGRFLTKYTSKLARRARKLRKTEKNIFRNIPSK